MGWIVWIAIAIETSLWAQDFAFDRPLTRCFLKLTIKAYAVSFETSRGLNGRNEINLAKLSKATQSRTVK